MKKNISINISGILFHIEEDGYEDLKKYLDSITNYFSSFEGSTEIIADIESRIAEIFLEKLNENKQVISLADVTELMATMGSIKDFEALEDENTEEETTGEKQESTPPPNNPWEPDPNKKRLYRDNQRKLLGGVAAGIAHYFSIDVVWIRLAFVLLLFDAFLSFALAPLSIIAYIVLWIAVPASNTLEEDKSMKKLFRNPEGKVLGGVAQGLSAFLGIDVAIIRVLFVVSIFLGGAGVIAYLVLWIILPQASGITDKVMMKGEKVTLENIDSSIKQAEEEKTHTHEESTFAKIFLFPFRVLGTIFTGLGHALKPILLFFATLVRLFFGAIISIVGASGLFALTVLVIAAFGILVGTDFVHLDHVPIYLLSDSIPEVTIIGGYLTLAIPALLLLLVGVSLLVKRSVIGTGFGWAIFGLWVIGLVMLIFSLPNVLYNYKEDASVTNTQTFNANYSSIYLDVNTKGSDSYDGISLTIEGYDGDQIKLEKEFKAKGNNQENATKNATAIDYKVVQTDSILTFDRSLNFKKGTAFRDQNVRLKLYIPYGVKFKMNPRINSLLRYGIYKYGYHKSDIKENVFYFNETGLDCSTCLTAKNNLANRKDFYEDVLEESTSSYGNLKKYPFKDFTSLEISGPFEVNIAEGEAYRVVLEGNDRYLEKVDIEQKEHHLKIAFKDDEYIRHRGNVAIRIIMPRLSSYTSNEASETNIAGFTQDSLKIVLASTARAKMDLAIKTLTLTMSSTAKLELMGTGDNLHATLSSASRLRAYKYSANNVWVKVTSAAKANVLATETLTIRATTLGEVNYRGGAEVTHEETSALGRAKED